MWSVEYQVTTPSTISIVAMATSAVSSSAAARAAASSSATSSRRQCVGRAPGMLLEDVFELCRKSKEDRHFEVALTGADHNWGWS